jgi:protein-L-isoaspartate(D-aspartate) O-methyltransferase
MMEGLEAPAGVTRPELVARLIAECAEPFDAIDQADLTGLMERIGDARVVLLGEATHGTAEFYRMRARITRELVRHLKFNVIAVEADWPDATRVDRFVRQVDRRPVIGPGFTRFPIWMWRNREMQEFAEWLREHNGEIHAPEERVAFYGLDLYSMFTSIHSVLGYLEQVDRGAAELARRRYEGLMQWEHDPAGYGALAVRSRSAPYEAEVVATLEDLLARRLDYIHQDGERFLDAAQNARLVANAERYYREMYHSSVSSWNLRDRHMFETLQLIVAARGPEAKAIVWAHNSHVGDARATEMGAHGEFNIGQLCRVAFQDQAYLVGFGTDHGTVAAASNWDEPMEIKPVRPAHPESYEYLCHEARTPRFLLSLRTPFRDELREELRVPRLERAIGVIYRPETELQSHYFHAVLPRQFDEYIWFGETNAVSPLEAGREFP